jgi:hypothetical protein
MHSQLKRYLHDVERYLNPLPKPVRDSEVREISSHLEQLHFDLCSEGYTEGEAASRAIKSFGSARGLGLNLRDVREGNWSLLLSLLVVVGSNWILFRACSSAIAHFVLFPAIQQSVLMPALSPILTIWNYTATLLLPFGLNFALGWWGGRRISYVAPLSYLHWLLLFRNELSTFEWSSLWIVRPVFSTMLLAMFGAWCGSTWMRHKRTKFAMVPTNSELPQGSSAYQQNALKLKTRALPLLSFLSGLLLMAGILWAWAQPRVNMALHPSTTEAAAQILFSTPSDSYGEMEPSTDVVMEVLPALSPAEKSGQERRVKYEATMHASEYYSERRKDYYERMLRSARAGRKTEFPAPMVQAALERLRPEGYRVRGILLVRKTASGWEIDKSARTRSDLRDWLYNVAHKEPEPSK